MTVLKGMALGLISFILFVALLIMGFTFTLNNTVLNPQFAVNEIDKLDIAATVHEAVADYLPVQYQSYLTGVDLTLVESMPWIKQQINSVVYDFYSYLLSETDVFSLSVPTQPLQQSLVKNITQVFLQSPPAEYIRLSVPDKASYLAQFQQQIIAVIPPNIEINRDALGANNADLVSRARDIAGYVHAGYFVLIAFILLLVLMIALILRDAKSLLRSVGVIFIIYGAISIALVFTIKYWLPGLLPVGDVPVDLQTWLFVVFNDVLSPWGIFNLSFLLGGLVLLTISFFLERILSVFADWRPV